MAADTDVKGVMDYQENKEYDLQPFFKAGSSKPLAWLHRSKGTMINSSLILGDKQTGIDEDTADTGKVVMGGGVSGMAGTTFYQTQAQYLVL